MLKKAVILLTVFVAVASLVFAEKKAEPLGTEENPIIWSFVPSGDGRRTGCGGPAS